MLCSRVRLVFGVIGARLDGREVGNAILVRLATAAANCALACFQLAVRRRQIGLCLCQPGFVIARINLQKQIAFVDFLIVLHEQFGDASRNLRRDRRNVSFNKRVVSGFKRQDKLEVINARRPAPRHRRASGERAGQAFLAAPLSGGGPDGVFSPVGMRAPQSWLVSRPPCG